MSPNKATYSLLFCGAPSSGAALSNARAGRAAAARTGAGKPPRERLPRPPRRRDRADPPPPPRGGGGGGFSTGERTAPGGGPARRPARAPPARPRRAPPSAAERGAGGRQRGSLAPTERERELQLAIDSEIYRQGDSPFCKNSLSPGSVHAANALWRRAEPPRLKEK